MICTKAGEIAAENSEILPYSYKNNQIIHSDTSRNASGGKCGLTAGPFVKTAWLAPVIRLCQCSLALRSSTDFKPCAI